MKLTQQNQSDNGQRFDVELIGHGRIAHVDAWGVDDPDQLRDLFCAAPDMLDALKLALEAVRDLDEQVSQMQGLFDDKDGAICAAQETGDRAASAISSAIAKATGTTA